VYLSFEEHDEALNISKTKLLQITEHFDWNVLKAQGSFVGFQDN